MLRLMSQQTEAGSGEINVPAPKVNSEASWHSMELYLKEKITNEN
jgi:hypothetical protein